MADENKQKIEEDPTGQYNILVNSKFTDKVKSDKVKNLKSVLPPLTYVKGNNYDALNGLYIDSSKDTYKNSSSGISDDKVHSINKVGRDKWYEWKVADYTVDTKNAAGKELFLKKNKTVVISYLLSYNLWNSFSGWQFQGGKFIPLSQFGLQFSSINLTGGNNVTMDPNQEYTDINRSKNERVQMGFAEDWDGYKLTISIVYHARVHWASGSIYDHAALVRSTQTMYAFVDSELPFTLKFKTDVSKFVTTGAGVFPVDTATYEAWLMKSAIDTLPEGWILPIATSFVWAGTSPIGYGVMNLFAGYGTPFMNDSINTIFGKGTLGATTMNIGAMTTFSYTGPSGHSETEPLESGIVAESTWTWVGEWTFAYLGVKNV